MSAFPQGTNVEGDLSIGLMVELPDPGDGNAIPVDKSAAILIASGAVNETRTVADPPAAGLRLAVRMTLQGGGNIDLIFASNIVNGTPGGRTAEFDFTLSWAIFESIWVGADTYAWRVVAEEGVTVAAGAWP